SLKYGLEVMVSRPFRDDTTVATWKIKVVTRPERKNLPLQRINIDICAVPSYDAKPAMLNNYYGVDMGTAGLILQAQSREEILADKYVALAFRKRVKNRDLWDILWLQQQGVKLPVHFLADKVNDHLQDVNGFLEELKTRSNQMHQDRQMHQDFIFEMRRFLPSNLVTSTIENPDFWIVLTDSIQRGCAEIVQAGLSGGRCCYYE
ncbi:MAG: nucleotidyl transferase AbiEii/AbiGii toxin family protein, partial [Desulfuromusa sp.]|nr:nucleotidyl transferase AbiEii/AbiGii toxin family protein [Desulfuromusa sp.]